MTMPATLIDILQPTDARRSTPAPRGLIEHLITAGYVTEDGISRAARVRPCRRCKTLVIVGLDADRAAFEAWCDPHPMSGLGEMLAAIAGHRTYELWRGPARFELEPRDADRIGYYRPISQGGQHRIDILRAHHCHARAPGETEVVPSTFTRPDVAIGDQPDF